MLRMGDAHSRELVESGRKVVQRYGVNEERSLVQAVYVAQKNEAAYTHKVDNSCAFAATAHESIFEYSPDF